MKTLKPLIFLLSLSLVIQPVLAEGFMLHKTPHEQSSIIQISDTQMHHTMMPIEIKIPNNTVHNNMPCCDEGIHFCESDCHDGNCLVITMVPASEIPVIQVTSLLEHSHTLTLASTDFNVRPITPELRPPLV